MSDPGGRKALLRPCAAVAVLTLLVFLPALFHGFVRWDDDVLILNNPFFRGLGWANLKWMFSARVLGHYMPLVWLSFALDHAVWGLNPRGYHLTNILLHAANAALACAVFRRLLLAERSGEEAPLDGALALAAAFGALCFSLHPLRVESVAWVAERKDVLSGFFYLLTVLLYLRGLGKEGPGRLLPALAAFAASLLAKSIVMTLPLALLLLDVYPLRRLDWNPLRWGSHRKVWAEKLPFVALSVLCAAVSYRTIHAVVPLSESYTKFHSAVFACIGAAYYLVKTLLPIGLTPLYQGSVPFSFASFTALGSVALVAGLCAGFAVGARRRPAGLAAWLFYLLTAAPVLGIVPMSGALASDRYSYLSCLSWALLAAGLLLKPLAEPGMARRAALAAGGLALLLLAGTTRHQLGFWKDTESLWRRALRIEPDNAVAHNSLGVELARSGAGDEALGHFLSAIRVRPAYDKAYNNLGIVLASRGRRAEAAASFRKALALNPGYAEARRNLDVLRRSGGREPARR